MCCNNQSRSCCRRSCWGSCQNTWDLERTGSSCYVSVPSFLCAAAQAEEESSAQAASHRFVVTGTIDQFRLLNNCGCSCN